MAADALATCVARASAAMVLTMKYKQIPVFHEHYSDAIMGPIASQITSLKSPASGADQRKHQSSASLAFVWGIHRGPVNSPHKWPVTRKMFPFDDVIIGRILAACAISVSMNDVELDISMPPQDNWSQNWRHFAGDIFKCIFLNENAWIFHWSVFLKFELTIIQHWFRWWFGTDQQWCQCIFVPVVSAQFVILIQENHINAYAFIKSIMYSWVISAYNMCTSCYFTIRFLCICTRDIKHTIAAPKDDRQQCFTFFSCDQAALQMVFSVCLSVRPCVCLSVCPSVTPFWLCSLHRIIMKFSGVITSDRSDVLAKVQGQRSKIKVTEVTTQLYRFRTVTPVWIHVWWWNYAYSLMMLRRGALLFFRVICQISRSHGSKNRRIWPKLGVSGL